MKSMISSTYRIYKIKNIINSDIYIGCTRCTLSQRLSQHKFSSKYENYKTSPLYKMIRELGEDKFYIKLIKEYDNINLSEARAMEGKYIRLYKDKYTGGNILNIRVECRTIEKYRDDNKEKILENKKEYREKNSDKISEYQKEHYEKNREKRLDQQKEYYVKNKDKLNKKMTCEVCGITCSKHNIYSHIKTKTHLEKLVKVDEKRVNNN